MTFQFLVPIFRHITLPEKITEKRKWKIKGVVGEM